MSPIFDSWQSKTRYYQSTLLHKQSAHQPARKKKKKKALLMPVILCENCSATVKTAHPPTGKKKKIELLMCIINITPNPLKGNERFQHFF